MNIQAETQDVQILVLGLDRVGKTALVIRVISGEFPRDVSYLVIILSYCSNLIVLFYWIV